MPSSAYDVAIVGGGVCGCSLLYALARYDLRVLLLERTNDVGVATTKANSAILHAGYDPEPDTLMARYNRRGNQLARDICRRLDILMREVGSLVVGFGPDDRPVIEELYQRGVANGVPGLRVVEQAELQTMEPNLAPEAAFALYAPTAAVVNPWELAFAQAEVALRNGADVWLNTEVVGIEAVPGQGFLLRTACTGGHAVPPLPGGAAAPRQNSSLRARFVVNAAGIHAAEVAALAGEQRFTISTSRGQYYLLDKSQGEMASHVIFQCPTPLGKGVLVAPTVHGNLIVGPDSAPSPSTATTAEGLDYVRQTAQKSVPSINFRESIRNFAGLRAMASTDDFIVGEIPDVPGLLHMAGIKSPGLTAAAAIAEDMVRMLAQSGLEMNEKESFDDTRSILRMNHMDEAQQAAAIKQNPLYGRIVCRCETVTEGEVVDALHRPLPPQSLDAVKRRCGPGMGRCQGGFCGPRVQAIIARELGLPQGDVPQDRSGMDIVMGRTKDEAVMDNAARQAAEAARTAQKEGGV